MINFNIIILSLNRVKKTVKCLNSIRLNTDKTVKHYKITILDNGSNEETLKILSGYCEAYQNIELIKLNKNMGVGRARKLGVKQNTCPYIIFLDNDMVVQPEWLDKLYIGINYGAVAVSGQIHMEYGEQKTHAQSLGLIPGGCTLYDKKAFEIAEIDEGYFVGYEDIDFMIQLKVKKCKLGWIDEHLFTHNPNENEEDDYNIIRRDKKHLNRSKAKFYKKWDLSCILGKPIVSVFMAIWKPNEDEKFHKWLEIAINSTLNQNMDKFELLIGKDGDIGSLQDVIDKFTDKRIKQFQFDKRGLTGISNSLIPKAKGEFITRIDADDYDMPKRFTEQVNMIRKDKNAGACGCWYNTIDENGDKLASCKPDPENIDELHSLAGSLPGSGTMIRANALREIGGWPKYKYAQDFALWVTLKKAGWELISVPDVLYCYRQHSDQISSFKRDEQKECHRQVIEDLCH